MTKRCSVIRKTNLTHDGGSYHIETNPLIYRANQCIAMVSI